MMKKILIYIFGIFLIYSSCKNNSTENISEADTISKPSNNNIDSSMELVDAKTTAMLREVKHIQELFIGNFKVYNADGKELKSIEIDQDGMIHRSNIYKIFRIYHTEEANRLILVKGTDENTAAKDTFEFEEKSGKIELYSAQTNKAGKMERKGLIYSFKKID